MEPFPNTAWMAKNLRLDRGKPNTTVILKKGLLTVITEASSCRSWEQLQTLTAGQCVERERPWNTQSSAGCLHQTANPTPQLRKPCRKGY